MKWLFANVLKVLKFSDDARNFSREIKSLCIKWIKSNIFQKVEANNLWEISCYKRFGIGQKHKET